jgi:hypothetical protein
VAVDQVEVALGVEHGRHRRQEVAHRVVLELRRPERDRNGRDVAARDLGVA